MGARKWDETEKEVNIWMKHEIHNTLLVSNQFLNWICSSKTRNEIK